MRKSVKSLRQNDTKVGTTSRDCFFSIEGMRKPMFLICLSDGVDPEKQSGPATQGPNAERTVTTAQRSIWSRCQSTRVSGETGRPRMAG